MWQQTWLPTGPEVTDFPSGFLSLEAARSQLSNSSPINTVAKMKCNSELMPSFCTLIQCYLFRYQKRQKEGKQKGGGRLFPTLYLFTVIPKKITKGRKNKSSRYLSKALFLEGKARPTTTHCSQQAPVGVGQCSHTTAHSFQKCLEKQSLLKKHPQKW